MTIKTLAKAILGVAAVSLWGLAPGCGTSVGALCNKLCDCVGCNDSELEECIDDAEDAKKLAEEQGCSDEYNDALSCSNSELECNDDGTFDLDGCDAEGKAYVECADGSPLPGGNACEAYIDAFYARYDECGLTAPDGGEPPPECTDELAAQATCFKPCIDLLTCGCLGGNGGCTSDEAQPYSDCVSSCL